MRLAALLATLIVPAAASAEVVTVSDSVSNLATSPSFQTAEGGHYDFAAWTPTLNLAQFDPSLGQLVGITVTIQTGLTNHLLLTGYTPQHLPQAYGACTFQLDWTCSISAPGAMVIPPDSRSGSGTLSGMLGYSQTSVFAAAPSGLSGPASYAVDAADFSLYTGMGTIPFELAVGAHFSCSNLLNCFVRDRILSNATVTIDYEYAPVPSPAVAAPLLLGGLCALRRRRV